MSHAASDDTFDIVVQIGAFQPWTTQHQQQLEADLSRARQVVLAVTGATRACNTRHPFSLTEQIQLLRLAIPSNWLERVSVLAVHLPYAHASEPQPTVAQWQQAVADVAGHGSPKVAARYLSAARPALPGHWHLLAPADIDADELAWRQAALGSNHALHVLQEKGHLTPSTCHDWLARWLNQSGREHLHEEWRQLQHERAAWASAPYPVTLVTVDAVVECGGQVLLIRRGRSPGRGLYALPGGFIDVSESLLQSACRELHEETGLNLADRVTPRASAVFDAPDRSQRGRVITHAWHFRIDAPSPPELQAGDDASEATWVEAARLSELTTQYHDDHDVILQHFLGVPHPPAIRVMAL